MSELTARERELVALGAAIGSNCLPCIEYHIPEARQQGLSDAQIAAAIDLAEQVKQVPARNVLAAAKQGLADTAPPDTREACCASSGSASSCC
jgi:4-carboxymuconolactone decarboxylase